MVASDGTITHIIGGTYYKGVDIPTWKVYQGILLLPDSTTVSIYT
jgi:hypothetical protein